MLPNHAPLVVAEQFGTLATLYPGRIDLGLGRAPGTDHMTMRALRRDRIESEADFPRDVAELQRKQKDVQSGIDERIRKLEPVKVSLDEKEFLADPEEKRMYEEAFAFIRKGDFNAAAAGLSTFVRRYPQSGYVDSAQFWLGNAQYGRREYREAIGSFRALLAARPEHPKAPEAMLAIANCQVELKDTKGARKTIGELVQAYPKSEAAQAGRERLASIK